MILGKSEIEALVDENGIIEGYDPVWSQNNPAKVELRLGTKCYLSSRENVIIPLSDGEPVTIPPNDIFLFQTLEKVNLPSHIAGHLSLKMRHTARGLLMSNQTQVDPGYRNYLFGMLYNLSDADITIQCGEPIVTLELSEVKNAGGLFYFGHMAEIRFEEFCTTRIVSSLGWSKELESKMRALDDLSIRVDEADKRNDRRLNILMTIVAAATLAITVVSILVAVMAFRPDANVAQLAQTVESQREQIAGLEARLAELERPPASPPTNAEAEAGMPDPGQPPAAG